MRPFVFADPPDHTRVRALVSKAFTARRLDRPWGREFELARELVGAARKDLSPARST